MSSTSRLYRDDELRETYEAQQYAFANQAGAASAGTTEPPEHIEISGPFAGYPLPMLNLPEREPTDDELHAIAEHQAIQVEQLAKAREHGYGHGLTVDELSQLVPWLPL